MTLTQHVVAFVAMAVAITTILAVGTLAAADIIHFTRPARTRTTRRARASRRTT